LKTNEIKRDTIGPPIPYFWKIQAQVEEQKKNERLSNTIDSVTRDFEKLLDDLFSDSEYSTIEVIDQDSNYIERDYKFTSLEDFNKFLRQNSDYTILVLNWIWKSSDLSFSMLLSFDFRNAYTREFTINIFDKGEPILDYYGKIDVMGNDRREIYVRDENNKVRYLPIKIVIEEEERNPLRTVKNSAEVNWISAEQYLSDFTSLIKSIDK